MRRLKVSSLLIGLWAVSLAGRATDVPLDGHWEGAVVRNGKELAIAADFRQDGEITGTLDVPDLSLLSYRFSEVRIDGSKIRFKVPWDVLTFDGVLWEDNIDGDCAVVSPEETFTTRFHLKKRRKPSLPYSEELVRFQSGDVTLAGSLLLPTTPTPHPAVVLVHGSGPQTRDSYHRFFADLFARRGIAALIYDKRGTGESGGMVWYQTGDNFETLAGDAVEAYRFLASRPDIRKEAIGFWGVSQAGWLIPMAISRLEKVGFAVILSGAGATVGEQELYDDEAKLRDKGFSEAEIPEAVALLKMADDYAVTGQGWDAFQAALQAAKEKPWYRWLDKRPLEYSKDDPDWKGWGMSKDIDDTPVLEKLRCPVLFIYGEEDKTFPTRLAAPRVQAAMERGGNQDAMIRFFPKASHGITVPPRQGGPWDWERHAPGFLDFMMEWMSKRTPRE